ncbi:MAG TPA: hypothetical protein VGM93_02220 [Acidimicrobiales bacterium]
MTDHLTVNWASVRVTMGADGLWGPDGHMAPVRAIAGGGPDAHLDPDAVLRAARLLGWRMVELTPHQSGAVDVLFHRPDSP